MKRNLKKILSKFLAPEDLAYIYNSYDIVGDIAIIRFTDVYRKYSKKVAETILSLHKNVKTVLVQVCPINGDFRLRKLEHVAGKTKTATVHKESGCLFAIDLKKCYFSPRLSYERMRIAKLVKKREVIVNMFAGAGCFSIVIATHSDAAKVYSVDINPAALQFMRENTKLNKVYGKIIPILGDVKQVVEKKFYNLADRVLMPLPEKAFEYLPYAILTLKDIGGWIHYYDFKHAKKNEDPVEKVKLKVAEKLISLNVTFDFPFSRVVRTIGPNWHQVVLDIYVSKFLGR